MNFDDFKTKITELFDEQIMREREEEPLNQTHFRASSIATCPRAILFQMMNLPKDLHPRAGSESARGYKLMQHGTDSHEYVQKQFMAIGILKKEDCERIILDDELLFSGHCDGILTFNDRRVLLEIKTINGRAFPTLRQPKEEHYYQAQAYMHFLNTKYGEHIDEVLFLYIDRNSDNMDFKPFVVKYDKVAAEMILNKLKILKEYLQNGKLYPIPPGYDPNDKNNYACRYCPFNTKGLCRSSKTDIKEFEGAHVMAKL